MSEERRGFRRQGEWRAWVGPALPFLVVGAVLLVALCVLMAAVLVSSGGVPTATPGLPLAQAQETATAQAVTAQAIQTQQATPPTRFPTLTPSPASAGGVFPFELAGGQVMFQDYPGCEWFGVAGDVSDMEGEPLTGVRVRVWGEDVDEVTLSGTSPDFGASGWEVRLGDAPAVGQYQVQLLAPDDEPLSPAITFESLAACDADLILVQFLQRAGY